MAKKPKTPKPDDSAKKTAAKPLSREPAPKPLSTPRQLQRAQILLQLQDLIVACEELFESHSRGCDCSTCSVTSHFIGALKLFRMVLEIS